MNLIISSLRRCFLIFLSSFLSFTLGKELKVGIVGAGAAGLSAGYHLRKALTNVEVTFFESTNMIGGRVRVNQNIGFIELGASIIKGPNTDIYKIIETTGGKLVEMKGIREDFDNSVQIHFNKTFGPIGKHLETSPELRRFLDVMRYIYSTTDHLPDISVHDFLFKNSKFNKLDFLALAQALISDRHGCDIEKLSLRGLNQQSLENREDEDVNKSYYLANSSIISHFFNFFNKTMEDSLAMKREIREIDYTYSSKSIKIVDSMYDEFFFDYVIVTSSTNVLFNQIIKFNPPLPKSKIEALDKLAIEPVGKLILNFKERIWDEKMKMVIFDGVINNLQPIPGNDSGKVLFSLVSGTRCVKLQKLYDRGQTLFLEKVLGDIEAYTGVKGLKNKLEGALWHNWENHGSIQGGYTYPVIDEGNSRLEVLKPLKGKIYFAGEAVSRYPGTLHGAVQSGKDVVNLIVKHIGKHTDL